MQLKNEVMLITYADSMGNNLKDLHKVLNQYYANAVGGVHILPFFPSSADRGFAPMCYDRVDPNFGTFADVEAIGKDYYLMFDFMVNHISAHSAYFQDLDVRKDATKQFIKQTLVDMCHHGAAVIRLDAFAYAIKKPDTSCFFVEPDIWELLYDIEKTVKAEGAEILPEIHEHYTIPMKIADKGFWIYDFALPVLTLHALYNHTGVYLKQWMERCPMHQFTTLDTHDGIGIVDVKDLLPDEEVDKVKEQMYQQGANVKKIYSSEAYNNLDIYQVNTTYYSALGNHDDAYLLARAIQFFAPGIPQVYYVGMLAGSNDVDLMERTKNGRDINRHYYSLEEVAEQQQRPVVQKLKELMELRNTHPAFSLEGTISIQAEGDHLQIVRTYQSHKIVLDANLSNYQFEIHE